MTDIRFYHLTRTPLERALPQLLLKVLESGKRAVLIAANDAELKRLDTLLWTFSTKQIIPHGVKSDGFAADQPVYLSVTEENPNGAEMLVAVGGVRPAFVTSFARCMDMFDGSREEELAAARDRWTHYAVSVPDTTLTCWKQDEKGAWTRGDTAM